MIDTVGLGYASLALRPLVVLPPVLLDLYLWLGLRITAKPLTVEAASWARDQGPDGATLARDIERIERFNVFEFLSLRVPTFRLPTLVPNLSSSRLDEIGGSLELSSLPWWTVVMVGLAAFALGVVIGAGWLVAIACAVTGSGGIREALRPNVTLPAAVSIASWIGVVLGIFLLVTSPFVAGAIVGAIVGFNGIGLFLLVLMFPAAWGYIFFFFSIQALIIDRIGPFAALKASYRVVRGYFWQSIRFIVLSLTITTGFPFALRVFTTSAPGLIVAIIGNAFIASGIIAAAMLFYRDRARRLGISASALER